MRGYGESLPKGTYAAPTSIGMPGEMAHPPGRAGTRITRAKALVGAAFYLTLGVFEGLRL
jgi:hypothetical protein